MDHLHSESRTCNICGNRVNQFSNSTILKKYEIEYFICENCNFIQTEEPYWLEEAYKSAINTTDTGILVRNSMQADVVVSLVTFFFNKKIEILDFAGGHGLFTRLMRDIGLNTFWQDKFADNIFARGFEYDSDKEIQLITAFEVFEHLVDPISEIEQLLKISNSILFSTRLIPKPIPKPEQWWYYGLEHGQHISFFSLKALKYIAGKYGLNFYSDGKAFHFLTTKKINPWLFRIIVKLAKAKFLYFLRKLYASKTEYDHNMLNNNLN